MAEYSGLGRIDREREAGAIAVKALGAVDVRHAERDQADLRLQSGYFGARPNFASALAMISRVWSIMSGLTLTLVMPHSTSFSVTSG